MTSSDPIEVVEICVESFEGLVVLLGLAGGGEATKVVSLEDAERSAIAVEL